MCSFGLVDSHLHLNDFGPGVDVQGIVDQAVASGVTHLVCNGTSESDWPQVAEYAKIYLQVIPCFGLHPWFVAGRSCEWASVLEKFICDVPSGVGETGLDKCVKPLDRALQEESLRIQLGIARKYRRPVMLHCVRSWGWLLNVLRSEPELSNGFLLHAYGGSVESISELVEMGAYFSFSGKVLSESYDKARKALDAVPRDRLLIETDAPNMLPPEKFRAYHVFTPEGKELNHPANLSYILECIAGLLKEDPETLKENLWQNAQRFFGHLIKE